MKDMPDDSNESLSDEKINFFTEDIEYSLTHQGQLRQWLNMIAQKADYVINELNYIFCSDTYLHQINVEYLNHDTYTDIITFDNSEESKSIEGDIFISLDRVNENAALFNVPFQIELQRVMAHGLLHLLGYGDKTDTEKQQMRTQEDQAIALWKTF